MKIRNSNINKTVLYSATAVFLLIFTLIAIFPKYAATGVTTVLNFTMTTTSWIYAIAFLFYLISCLYLAFSKYGTIRLGKPDDKPEYSFVSWMGMLFGAGVGAGIIFFGVYEPMEFFNNPPFGASPGTAEAAAQAMRSGFLHWSFMQWAIHAAAGLAFAYAMYNKGKAPLMSSCVSPLLGKKSSSAIENIIDSFGVIGVVCGVAMSVGAASVQAATGLSYQFGTPINKFIQTAVIVIIGLVGIISALSAISKGIKFISDLNLRIFACLVIFAFLVGPSNTYIKVFFQGFGDLLSDYFSLSLFTDAYGTTATAVGYDWCGGWTIMYWGWTAAFAPFTAAFLAKISKGRTIREFALAAITVPGVLCCLWLTVMGYGAIHLDLFGIADITQAMTIFGSDASLFIYLGELPLSKIVAVIAAFMILTMVVTSVNSATFMAGQFCTTTISDPPVGIRAYWGIIMILFAALFNFIGGTAILKNLAIVMAFPTVILTIMMVLGLFKELRHDYGKS